MPQDHGRSQDRQNRASCQSHREGQGQGRQLGRECHGAGGSGVAGACALALDKRSEDGGTRQRGRTVAWLRAKHLCRRGRRTGSFVGQDGGGDGPRDGGIRRPRLCWAGVTEAARFWRCFASELREMSMVHRDSVAAETPTTRMRMNGCRMLRRMTARRKGSDTIESFDFVNHSSWNELAR